jgi:RNA polymerase sigma factor (TIGR02999 family)
METRPTLTVLINQWRTGDTDKLNQIVPAVYEELHRVARGHMRGQPRHHTLQATALVNEAILKLDNVKSELEDRGHFIGIVSNVMRQILVDHARAKNSQKRGSGVANLSIDDVDVSSTSASIDVLALEEVLQALEQTQPRLVRVAELIFFCGATAAEAATALDVSPSTLNRDLALLKALLAKALAEET